MRHLAIALCASALAATAPFSTPAAAQLMEAEFDGIAADRGTSIAFAPGVTNQCYVATKRGRIWVFRNGDNTSVPFMTIQPRVLNEGEGGLLGLAFHPDFQTNGFFYVTYGQAGTSHGDIVVSRFQTMPGSVDAADPNSEVILFGPVPQSSHQHKGGDLEFGLDGMLYFSLGDGDPGLVTRPSQDLTDPRGKILRFDVDAPFPHVPADNPYVSVAGAVPQAWAIGFRNPFRFDVDPLNGDLYVADVGTSIWEEVNLLPAGTGGLNGGWPCIEGSNCLNSPGCTCPSPDFLDPIAMRPHSGPEGYCSITGGVMYRGSAIPGLYGYYIYSDFCTGLAHGVRQVGGAWVEQNLSSSFTNGGGQITVIADYARDSEGEVWFLDHFGAGVWRLVPKAGWEEYCTSNANSSGAAATLSVSGSTTLADANLTLNVSDLPANQFGFFILSQTRAFTPMFGGYQGNLCMTNPIYRWNDQVLNAGSSGTVSRTTDFTDLPIGGTFAPGETWNFQYWTRDVNPNQTSNTSSAVAVTFAL